MKKKMNEMEENNGNLKWPESCHYHGGSEPCMGHITHLCKHPMNDHSCVPCACPLNKLDKYQEELKRYIEEEKTCDAESQSWYDEQIPWIEAEIEKILDC